MSDDFSTGLSGDAQSNRKADQLKARRAALERAAEKAVQEELAASQEESLPKLEATGGIDRAKLAKRIFNEDGPGKDPVTEAVKHDPVAAEKRRRGR